MSTHVKPDADRFVIESSLNFSDLNNVDVNNPESALIVKGGAFINNDLFVNGTLVVNGDVISLGNTGGTLTLNSNISSNVEPSSTDTYNLGSTTKYWSALYANTVNISQSSTTDFTSNNTVIEINASTNAAVTLADTTNGDVKIIVTTVQPTAPVVVTPTNANSFASVTFTNVGDSATLLFVNGSWNIISTFRASVN